MLTLTMNGSKEEMDGTKQLQHFFFFFFKSQKFLKVAQPYLRLSEELITSAEAYPKASARPLISINTCQSEAKPLPSCKIRL